MDTQSSAGILVLPALIIGLILAAALIALIVLLVRVMLKYLRSGEARKERTVVRQSLGEALKEERLRCQMTQEFVAERLGVSRQAVSKWENGIADPSTSNLLALAKLYGVDAAELLRSVPPEET